MAKNMQEQQLGIKFKFTLVKWVALFVCRYIKSKFILNQLSKFTIVKIYCNGKIAGKITLGEILK